MERPRYPYNELVDMLLLFGECHRNDRQAAMMYAHRFPDRRHPDRRMFRYVEKRLRQHGVLHVTTRPLRTRQRDPNEVNLVREAVAAEPQTSTRDSAQTLGIHHVKVHRIIKEDRDQSNHATQCLQPDDHAHREASCESIAEQEVEGEVEECKEEMKILEDVKSVFLLNDAVQEQEPSISDTRVPLDTMRMKSCLKQKMLLDKNCGISNKPSDIQNPVYKCHICDMAFAKKRQIQAHVIVHGDGNFQCDICFKQYARKGNLDKHIRLVHEDVEKIRCFCCRRKFITYNGLREHLNVVHMGEHNFKCSICKNSYSDFSTLSTHLLEHMKGT